MVALESCGGSSYWAREIKQLGHEVRLIPAQHVKAFLKGQKNDKHDAEAIAEAALTMITRQDEGMVMRIEATLKTKIKRVHIH